jgi:hypothetical protein
LPASGDVEWLASTIMPDHVHLLLALGGRLELGRLMAKIKGNAARHLPELRPIWQENAFEHRLRAGEDAEAYAFYLFMNPYRAGLVAGGLAWPWWFCSQPARFGFLAKRNKGGGPQAHWDEQVEQMSRGLVLGE